MPEINPADLPGNSNGPIPEEKFELPKKPVELATQKKVTKVTSGNITKKKKSFFETFLGENLKTVGGYILYDVLIPAAKDTIADVTKSGIEMLLYGESRNNNSRRDKPTIINYTGYSTSSNRDRERSRFIEHREEYRSNNMINIDDFVFAQKTDAQDVINSMVDMIDKYGRVSVGDFYDFIGKTGDYTFYKYGWDRLGGAAIRHVRDGWVLDLPRPIPLG